MNGVATVNIKLMTVGTQTITATAAADPTLTGTVSSAATPPIPVLFAVSGYPATTAGVANTFTVTVRDSIGQVATGYTGTVFFSSSDVQAGLPASYTFTAADGGVHTFYYHASHGGHAVDRGARRHRRVEKGSGDEIVVTSPRPRSPASAYRRRSPTPRGCWLRPTP